MPLFYIKYLFPITQSKVGGRGLTTLTSLRQHQNTVGNIIESTIVFLKSGIYYFFQISIIQFNITIIFLIN